MTVIAIDRSIEEATKAGFTVYLYTNSLVHSYIHSYCTLAIFSNNNS